MHELLLVERRDTLQRLVAFCSQPIVPQFLAVDNRPLNDQRKSATRERSFEDVHRLDPDDGFIASVDSMKVRRGVVQVVVG
jgi:hypothetical protein